MAFANGVFSRLYSWVTDRDGGIKVRADRMDAEMDGIKDALNEITAGTVQMIGSIKGYDGTVLAPGYGFNADPNTGLYRIGTDNLGVALAGVKHMDMSTTGIVLMEKGAPTSSGTDTITLTWPIVASALASEQRIVFKAGGTNTGAATLNLNSLGAKAVRKISGGTDIALSAGDITVGNYYTAIYDATANSAAGAWVLSGSASVAAATTSAAGIVLSLDTVVQQPGGRLTLTTATPVLTTDVTAAATIYYALYNGNRIPIYNGSLFVSTTFTELSLALSSNSGHTGYHQSGKNFDLFVINDSGTIRLASGPAWTTDTTRSAAISRVNGIYVNTSSMTARFGSASGNTVTVAASQGTYVGTFRASADGQTQVKFGSLAANGGDAWIGIWNVANRRRAGALVRDNTDSWTYSTATWRSANNSTTNRVSLVRGLDEDIVDASFVMPATVSSQNASLGIGLDSTSSPSGIYPLASVGYTVIKAEYVGLVGVGFHYLQALEYSSGPTVTFSGDLGVTYSQSGLSATFDW